MQEEIAPPFERWPQHLRDLDDRALTELAKDYRWLGEEARTSHDVDSEFEKRRAAVAAECERRGMRQLADECRRPMTRSGGGAS